jgi:hypothetical protein
MIAQCSNPDCAAPFDYREGRLVRFCKLPSDHQSLANEKCVEHFWLCGSCSEIYTFEFESGPRMVIKPRDGELPKNPIRAIMTAA